MTKTEEMTLAISQNLGLIKEALEYKGHALLNQTLWHSLSGPDFKVIRETLREDAAKYFEIAVLIDDAAQADGL